MSGSTYSADKASEIPRRDGDTGKVNSVQRRMTDSIDPRELLAKALDEHKPTDITLSEAKGKET